MATGFDSLVTTRPPCGSVAPFLQGKVLSLRILSCLLLWLMKGIWCLQKGEGHVAKMKLRLEEVITFLNLIGMLLHGKRASLANLSRISSAILGTFPLRKWPITAASYTAKNFKTSLPTSHPMLTEKISIIQHG